MDWNEFITESSAPFRKALERHVVRKRLAKGELLFDQGEHDDRLFVLDSGLLEVNVISESGKKLALNQLRPLSVFGEIALFDPGQRTARVEALEPSEVRSVRHADFVTEMRDAPEIGTELMRLAGLRMRWLTAQVEEQVFLPPPSRLAAKIIYLKDESGVVRMSQAQLADFVGVSREVVSKTLTEWRREEIIEVGRGRITVRDEDALRDIRNHFL